MALCVELLPELIRLDDWGYPIIDQEVPPELLGLADRAVDACPTLALLLEGRGPTSSGLCAELAGWAAGWPKAMTSRWPGARWWTRSPWRWRPGRPPESAAGAPAGGRAVGRAGTRARFRRPAPPVHGPHQRGLRPGALASGRRRPVLPGRRGRHGQAGDRAGLASLRRGLARHLHRGRPRGRRRRHQSPRVWTRPPSPRPWPWRSPRRAVCSGRSAPRPSHSRLPSPPKPVFAPRRWRPRARCGPGRPGSVGWARGRRSPGDAAGRRGDPGRPRREGLPVLLRPAAADRGHEGSAPSPRTASASRRTDSGESLVPLIHHGRGTGLEGKFSLQYGLACALLDDPLGLESFGHDAVARPAARRLIELVGSERRRRRSAGRGGRDRSRSTTARCCARSCAYRRAPRRALAEPSSRRSCYVLVAGSPTGARLGWETAADFCATWALSLDRPSGARRRTRLGRAVGSAQLRCHQPTSCQAPCFQPIRR